MSKIYHLKNKKEQKNFFLLRLARAYDVKGICECIYDEYKQTYFKKNFYDFQYLKEEIKKDNLIFIVAYSICKKEIAGIVALKKYHTTKCVYEICSQIIKKKYRGYGLAMKLFEYAMSVLDNKSHLSVYCLPVLFHTVTQRLMKRFDMTATGIIMNVFDVEKITHSYFNGRNKKHSQGVLVKKALKNNAGVLYVPLEHREFCKNIYDSLNVKYEIAKEQVGLSEPFRNLMICTRDDKQQSFEIWVIAIGDDFIEQLYNIMENFPLIGKNTANIFLNINDKNAVWAYYELKKKGWYFTGFCPLYGNGEYMILHNNGEVQVFFDDYCVDEEFRLLINYILENGGNKYGRSS